MQQIEDFIETQLENNPRLKDSLKLVVQDYKINSAGAKAQSSRDLEDEVNEDEGGDGAADMDPVESFAEDIREAVELRVDQIFADKDLNKLYASKEFNHQKYGE